MREGEAQPSPTLTQLDERLRPLRRVLAGLTPARAARPYLAQNLRRLVSDLRALAVSDPVLSWVDELDLALLQMAEAESEQRVEQAGTAWQLVQQIDRVLGLSAKPVPAAKVAPRMRVVEPAAVEGGSAPSGRQGRRHRRVKSALHPARAAVHAAALQAAAADDDESDGEDTEPGWAAAGWRASVDELDLDEADVEALIGAGVHSLLDVVRWRPAAARTLAPVHGAGRALPEGVVAIGGRVRARVSRVGPGGLLRSELVLMGADRLVLGWHAAFGSADLARLTPGAKVVVAAEVTAAGDGAVSVSGARLVDAARGEAYELALAEDPALSAALGRARAKITALLASASDPLPSTWVQRLALQSLSDAAEGVMLRGPLDAEGARRLGFDELFAAQAGLMALRAAEVDDRGIAHPLMHRPVAELVLRGLASELGDLQLRALEDVKRDLAGPAPMRRVLLGDAGAGAADVALRAVLMVATSRSQVLVVCHDAMSAVVRHDQWQGALAAFGIQTLLVQGEPRRADRDALRRGDVHVIVSAPGAFDWALEWRRLGLVVAEEQAVYGGIAQQAVQSRAPRPDVLVVCRTPVPWQRLHDAYAGFDLSRVGGEREAYASVVPWRSADREAAYDVLHAAVAAGGSALVAFPLRRTVADLLDLREAGAVLSTLSDRIAPGCVPALFHGALTAEQRDGALRDFEERRTPLLVATTYVEMVTAMPRAVVAVVEHADRVDLQRLLSLRALLGPSGVLHAMQGEEPNANGVRVLEDLAAGLSDEAIVARHTARFVCAEQAPAVPEVRWRWADPSADLALVVAARELATGVLRGDKAVGDTSGALRHAVAIWTTMSDAPCPVALPKSAPTKKRRRRRRKR